MIHSDSELIKRTLAGDESAFGVLVDRYKGAVHALVYRKIGDFHTAEELTQDAFLQAYQKLSTLRNPASFASWLYVIASRCCLMWHRKKRVPTHPLDEVKTDQIKTIAQRADQDEQLRQQVRDALESLPESQRTVLTLHYFGGLSCEEIGRFIGTSQGAVKDRLYRARIRLREEIKKMMQETFRGYQLLPTFTPKLLERIANFKPTPTVSRGQPLTPWSITTALTIALIVGSSLIGIPFQLPYSLDVEEPAKIVEIIDTPLLDRAPLHTNQHGGGQMALQAIVANAQEEQSEAPSNLPATPNRVTGTHIATLKQDMNEEAAYLTSVAFSPDGKTVASGSGDNLIQLWDVSTQQHIATLTGHTGEVSSVVFSPDGTKLASGAFDYTAKLWDVSTKQYRNIATLPSPNGGVTVAFSPDGTTVAVGAWDDTLRLWDVSTRGVVTLGRHIIPMISSVAFSPDSAIVAVGLFDNEDIVQMWHLETGQSITTLEGHTDKVSSVVFSPDGKTVATGSWDHTVQLWDVSTGRNITTLKGHTGRVTSVAYSPKGKMLASGAEDRSIQLWDVSTGDNITTLEVHPGAVTSIAYSPDRTTLASAVQDGTVWLWALSELIEPKTQPATDGNGGVK